MDKRPEKMTEQDEILEIQMRAAPKSRIIDIVTIITMLGIMAVLTIAFIILPDKEFSDQENRTLQQLPSTTTKDSGKILDRLIDGSYTADIAKYYADQFPARDFFIGVKGRAEILQLKRENNDVILARDNYQIAKIPTPNFDMLEANVKPVGEFAESMNKMGVPVYIAVAGRTFDAMKSYLPSVYPKIDSENLWSYMQYLGDQYSSLKYVNLLSALTKIIDNSSDKSPLYYHTDHHWTTLGAYYAYCEIISSLRDKEVKAQPLSAFTVEHASTEFYGTTWSKAGMKWVKPDTLDYYRYKGDDTDYITTITDTGVSFNGFYDRSWLEKKDKYSSFQGGNFSRVDIKRTDGKSREKLLVIKDSFANSVIPFLAYHYDLIILDMRFYTDSVAKLVFNEGVSRVLFLNNIANITDVNLYGILEYGQKEAVAAYIKSQYPISDIQVNGNSIENYKIVCPEIPELYYTSAQALRDIILEKTGFELEIVKSSDYESFDKALILSDTELPASGLVKIAVEGNNLVLRSTARTGIDYAVDLFITKYIAKATGVFNFGSDYIYTDFGNELIVIMPK